MFKRFLPALIALLMLIQPALAEGDIGDIAEACSTPVDTVVEEAADVSLDDGETDSADTAVYEAMEEQAESVDAPGTRTFQNTIAVETETWSDVNLVRAPGFAGKLASVTGCLTLSNVTIEGQPVQNVNLPDWFDLNSGASIVIADAATFRLSADALGVSPGERATLTAVYNGSAVKGGKVKWKSSDKKVVKVGKKGRIVAKGKGTTVITASYKGQTAVCHVVVTGVVYPRSVKLKKKKLTLALNSMATLKAVVKPANADDPTLTWASSNPAVASVDDQGNVAGLSAGKATIYVSTANGKTASCRVTVKAIRVKSMDFAKLYVTMHPGEIFQTTLKVKPKNTSCPDAVYVSSDNAVATVDESGLITAVGVGTATIAAASPANPKVQNTCKVCVIDYDAAQLEGLIIGINPGHQRTMIKKRYPMAPGSHSYGPGVKVGATGCSTRQTEYSVVLDVGLKLKRILEEHGAKVVITRTSNDVMLTNIDRAKMLNAAGVDVALQLHNNSCSNASKTGVSGYIRTTGSWYAESRALAKCLCRGISASTGFKNRGINLYNDYMSLNWTTTPSVLLEMGYLSNSSDDHKLAKDSFREALAQGIYQGLCDYFGR